MPLMTKRFQSLKNLGCQSVETDNMDCFDNEECWKGMQMDSGEEARPAQIAYLTRLSNLAHGMDMVRIYIYMYTRITNLISGYYNEKYS